MAQAVDAVAHHEAHRAGVVVRPHRLGAVRLLRADERFGDDVESIFPAHRGELAAALGAGAPQRTREAVGMMDALGVARDLGADHAGRVGVVLGAADAADGALAEDLDLERAGRWAVVRTSRGSDAGADGLIHGFTIQKHG